MSFVSGENWSKKYAYGIHQQKTFPGLFDEE